MTIGRWASLDARARRTVGWVGSFWVLLILLQRITVPGLPVSILIPVCAVWAIWGLSRGIVELDRGRLSLWLGAFGAASLLVLLQSVVLVAPIISITSLLLFAAVWAPFTLRLVDRRRESYVGTLRLVAVISACLAALATVMMASMLLGVRYSDWFGDLVPKVVQFPPDAYVITYPIEWQSEIYRANAWIGLEPSFVSAQIGVGIVAALLARMRSPILLVLLVGMLSTTAGSGFLLVAVALVVMALQAPMFRSLLRLVPLGIVAVALALLTDQGQNLISRLSEGSRSHSSTSLRTILPYERFWPLWSTDPSTVLLGRGPGSTERISDAMGVTGLLVPTPIKIFFEYGLLVGLLIAAFMLLVMMRGPSLSMAFTLVFSLWTLQPGSTTFLIVAPALLLVTLWSPREGPVLEQLDRLDDHLDAAPMVREKGLHAV